MAQSRPGGPRWPRDGGSRAAPAVNAARERAALRRRLRRSERLRRWQAALLVAPLLLFLLVFFLLPIAGMLLRSVDNPELRAVMPATAALIRGWNGEGLPDEQVFAAFAAELRAARDARSLRAWPSGWPMISRASAAC